ncbi:acyl carrier protein, partial [Tahibacter harae]
AKAALSSQGVLLLNEMSTGGGLFTHLTFGLTKGWWLFEDEAIRIPGSPAVWPATWQRVLQQEGFHGVGFPAEEAHGLGQTIIVAQSDGVVRQGRAAAAAPAAPAKSAAAVPAPAAPAAPAPAGPARVSEQDLQAHVHRHVVGCLASSLRVDPSAIDADESFADYGLDSILGVRTASEISQALGVELTTTSLFDYPTVTKLVGHILRENRTVLLAQLGADAASASAAAAAPAAQPAAVPAVAPAVAAAAPAAAPPSREHREAQLRQTIVKELAAALRVDPAVIDIDEAFVEYGLDSIMGVRLASDINQALGIELTTTSLFDYPSVSKLAQHIAATYAAAAPAASAPAAAPAAPAAPAAAVSHRFSVSAPAAGSGTAPVPP